MKTTITKTFEVQEPIEKVWSYLSNPHKIISCVPGASITETLDEQNYKGEVSMKFGPVKVKYNGQITIDSLDEQNYVMLLSGKGLDAKGKGNASMNMEGKLSPANEGTEVRYTMELSIVGMLAQLGSRLINSVSTQLVNQFANNFKAKLAEEVDT